MKIHVVGKAHLKGTSKKTQKPYDFLQLHYLGLARGRPGRPHALSGTLLVPL